MRIVVGIILIVLGFYFLPTLSFSLVIGAFLLAGGALAIRSGVTGKKMIGKGNYRQLGS